MERVEIDDVEPSDHGTVQQDRAQVRDMAGRFDERDDPFGRVGAVDLDRAEGHRLHALREREDDGRDASPPIGPLEAAVVDGDQAQMRLREGTP